LNEFLRDVLKRRWVFERIVKNSEFSGEPLR
jgi:hypothetical protein